MVYYVDRRPLRQVVLAVLTPGLRQQFPDTSGPHLSEEGSSVHCSKVGQVSVEVQLLGYYRKSRVLKYYVSTCTFPHMHFCKHTKSKPLQCIYHVRCTCIIL